MSHLVNKESDIAALPLTLSVNGSLHKFRSTVTHIAPMFLTANSDVKYNFVVQCKNATVNIVGS